MSADSVNIRSLLPVQPKAAGTTLSLNEIKAVELELLDAFAAWCAEHSLTYWLNWGTLIGAIRHKGFIPWDDDIDLAMPYDDFMRMIDLVNDGQGMPAPYRFVSNKIPGSVSDRYAYVKVFDMRTKAVQHEFRPSVNPDEGVWIDVFPLVGVFTDPAKQLKYSNGTYRAYTMGYMCSCGLTRNCALSTLVRRALIYPYVRLRGYRYWLRRFDRLLDEYPRLSDSAQCVIPPCNSSVYDTEDFAETIRVDFEGGSYPAPAGYDSILRIEYGDYMQLPPEDERVSVHDLTATWR
jgi:lipopolysaccharide cholinephosphotransferase